MRIIFGFLLTYMLNFPCYQRETKRDTMKSSYFENASTFYKVFCNKPELSFGYKRDFVVNILLKVFGDFKTSCNLSTAVYLSFMYLFPIYFVLG